MTEQWKDIQGYENCYQISSQGRVRSKERIIVYNTGRKFPYSSVILKAKGNKDGYLQLSLSLNNIKKTHQIHRLVALHFVDNPNGYLQVNHIDGNKLNNNDWNLEWCDVYYNINHSYTLGLKKVKFTFQEAELIRELCKQGIPRKEISLRFNISLSHISGITTNRRRTSELIK